MVKNIIIVMLLGGIVYLAQPSSMDTVSSGSSLTAGTITTVVEPMGEELALQEKKPCPIAIKLHGETKFTCP